MNKVKMFFWSMFFLLLFGLFPGFTAEAYSIDEIGEAENIGQYGTKQGDYSHVGVSVSLNGDVRYYVLDTYKLVGDSFNYVGTNCGGDRKLGPEYIINSSASIPIYLYSQAYFRFQLNTSKVFERMPQDYSLVSKEFSLGEKKQSCTDFSFQDHSFRKSDGYSLYCSSALNLSSCSGNSLSFTYDFYTPISLENGNKDVSLQLPEGASITENGKAYVTEDGYYIDKLPEVSYSKPGYTMVFDGWYTQKTGGEKITETSEITSGTKLYARYTENVNPYKVTCYDILGKEISGRELGKAVVDAYPGDKVSGADFGNNTAVGAYYDGLVYHSCTEKTVSFDTTIYRFFTYPSYPVTYVDQISEGKDSGTILRTQILQKEINSTVSGSDLGTVQTAGEYYKGYSYSGATTATVSKDGTTVYRYFKPHTFCILFHGNGNTGGTMENMENCVYGQDVQLPAMNFEKKISVRFDLNAQDASEGPADTILSQFFSGWAKEAGAAVFCADGAVVSDVTDCEDSINLYAVWSGAELLVDTVPKRKGYQFMGWSENPEALEGTMQFTLNKDTTLYAVWQKENAKYHLDFNYNEGVLKNEEIQPKESFREKNELAISQLPEVRKDGYEFVGWNTREDGSGVTIKSDEDLVKVFSEDNEASLYAVWKPSENTGFTLKLYKDSSRELLSTLVLQGRTGEKVSEALKKIYADTLGEDQVWQFYEGYEILNKEVLDAVIQADGSTELTCYLSTRICEVTLIGENKENGQPSASEKLIYKDSYTLPKTLENNTIQVDRYRDSDGKTYEAGEKIVLEKNKTFYAQHLIHFYSDGKELKEKELYIDHGKKISLPSIEKTGYQFLGWKEKDKDKVYNGEALGDAVKGYELYAVWSEPNTYKISYEIEDHLIKIAENQVNSYQYGKETILPDKMQVIVENGYEFKGWYLKDDPKQTLLTKLSKNQLGDVILKAKLVKTDSKDSEKQKNNKEKDNEKNSEKNNTAEGTGKKDAAKNDASKTDASKNDVSKSDASKTENGQTASNDITSGEGKVSENGEKTDGVPASETNPDLKGENSDKQGDITNPSLDAMKQNANDGKKQKKVTFQKGGFKYQIISKKKKTVMLVSGKGKKKLTIPDKLRYKGKDYLVIQIGKKAFSGDDTVQKLVISTGIQKINGSAFANMKKLKQVTIGKNVSSIGKKAFYGNKKLTRVTVLSKKLKNVQKTAFKGIAKKAVFQFPAGKEKEYKKFMKK